MQSQNHMSVELNPSMMAKCLELVTGRKGLLIEEKEQKEFKVYMLNFTDYYVMFFNSIRDNVTESKQKFVIGMLAIHFACYLRFNQDKACAVLLFHPYFFRFLAKYKCEDDLKKLNKASYTSAGIPSLLEDMEEACGASWESAQTAYLKSWWNTWKQDDPNTGVDNTSSVHPSVTDRITRSTSSIPLNGSAISTKKSLDCGSSKDSVNSVRLDSEGEEA